MPTISKGFSAIPYRYMNSLACKVELVLRLKVNFYVFTVLKFTLLYTDSDILLHCTQDQKGSVLRARGCRIL